MPLAESCRAYVGRNLLVLPYYGYGWGRPDLDGPVPEPFGSLGPEPFHVGVKALISCAGQLVGASGNIEEPDHRFKKQWCAFYLRSVDESDFASHPGHYMIWIALTELPVHPAPDKALYQWVTFERSSPCLCGYGMVAETAEAMGQFYELTLASRKRAFGEPR